MSVKKEPLIPTDDQLDLKDVFKEATAETLANRKQELSNQITKLFHKVDALSRDKRSHENAAKKASEKLDKALGLVERLKKGDWSVVKELKQQEAADKTKTPTHSEKAK